MTNPITKASELIDFLKNDPSHNLFWNCGNRPAAPGSYKVGCTRVYAKAVNDAIKLGAIKIRRADHVSCMYVLSYKFRTDAA